MRTQLTLLAIALTIVPGLRTVAKAQEGPNPGPPSAYPLSLPRCAQPALDKAIENSGCGPTDTTCICSERKLVPNLLRDIKDDCSSADRKAVEAFTKTYCGDSSPPGSRTRSNMAKTTRKEGQMGGHRTKSFAATTTATETVTKMKGSDKPTSKLSVGGVAGAAETGLSAAAMVAAVGAMGWVFAEL